MSNNFGRRLRVGPLLAVTALVLASGGGWALAATGGSVIHACASKKSGALRVARKCRKRERGLTWSAQSPAGPRGLQGATGAIGPQGPAGSKGPQGPGATALQFSSTPSLSATTLGQAGGYTFKELCVPKGGGTVEEIVTAGNQGGWQGYGTVSTEPGTASSATTTLTAPSGSPGLAGALWTFDVASSQTLRLAGDFQLQDPTLKTVVEVHLSANVDAVAETCVGMGDAIPAS
jgi:hypothetical protein